MWWLQRFTWKGEDAVFDVRRNSAFNQKPDDEMFTIIVFHQRISWEGRNVLDAHNDDGTFTAFYW